MHYLCSPICMRIFHPDPVVVLRKRREELGGELKSQKGFWQEALATWNLIGQSREIVAKWLCFGCRKNV
jgi:hypothetical protein